jgi:modulator of FtsH protease HflK
MSAVPAPAIGRIPETPKPAPKAWERRAIRAALVLFVLWLGSGIVLIPPDQQAVITRFGAVVTPRVYPGIHYFLPWPVDRAARVRVNQLQRAVIGGDVADGVLGRTQPLASQFLTGDQNIISMRVVAQYSVADPVDYLFRTSDVTRTVSGAVEEELARRVAMRGVDAILTTGKVALQNGVMAAAQRRLNTYRAGVKLWTVNIESVSPPPEAADAFRDVASARADAARIVDESRGYANDLIPRSRGEARKLMESAEAFRASRVNEANGDAARFTAIAAEYARAGKVTGERLYIETLEQILPKIKKLVIDPKANLDLSIIQSDSQPRK